MYTRLTRSHIHADLASPTYLVLGIIYFWFGIINLQAAGITTLVVFESWQHH